MLNEVQDKQAEQGIKFNNYLLTALFILTSTVGYLVDKNLDAISNSIKSIEITLSGVAKQSGINEARIEFMNQRFESHLNEYHKHP